MAGRGNSYGVKAIKKWMKGDAAGTRYGAECDIYHCFEELDPPYVIQALKRLFKDRETLWLCDALMEYGVLIGAFFSAWFLHLVLQPLDLMIHQREYGVSHYLRQMDNFTIFASSKRKLRKLIRDIQAWLADVGLKLKDNWQVFRIGFTPRVENAREHLPSRLYAEGGESPRHPAREETAAPPAKNPVCVGLSFRAWVHDPPKAQPVSAQANTAFILLPKGSKPGHLV